MTLLTLELVHISDLISNFLQDYLSKPGLLTTLALIFF